MVSELAVAAISATGVFVTILTHWFSSPDSEQQRQNLLRQELVDESTDWTESEKGNRFSLTITRIEVRESERLFYRLVTKPLPVIGGFTGETGVTAKIEGDVRLEEWALIQHIATSDEFRQKVADFQLNTDELVFVLNTADEDEIRKHFTGVVRAIEINDRYLADEAVRESDSKTLGKTIAGGVARPLFIDVAFPTRLVHKAITRPLRIIIKYWIGPMKRSFGWVRPIPMRRTSTTELRIRYPNQKPEPKDITALDWLYILMKPEKCSEGGVALLKMLHMGYRLRRDFLDEDGVIEENGATCLVVSIANLQETVDMERTRPSSDALITGSMVLNQFWGLSKDVDEPSRNRIGIPVDNFDPRLFEEIDLAGLSPDSREQLSSVIPSNGVIATAITGLGNGLVQAYYRGGDGSWYFTVRWGEDGRAEVWEFGEVDPEDPVVTEGFVLWERHHPGSRTSYMPKGLENLKANIKEQEGG